MADIKSTLPPLEAAVASVADGTVSPSTGTGADAAAAQTKAQKIAKKQKKSGDKKSEGKRGKLKGGDGTTVKAPREAKEKRKSEVDLLKGISKPATRRLFKQIKVHDKLRLADDATAAIRAIIGTRTRGIVHMLVKDVVDAGRQTAYLCDAKSAIHKEFPRSTVFVH